MATGEQCYNWKLVPIAHGERYFPNKAEPCETCVCNHGIPSACHNVHCKPPNCGAGEEALPIEGECCEYDCIDKQDVFNSTGIIIHPNLDSTDTFNRSMRLVASTVTTVLILGLLLYMFHRLKKRRVLVMMRRMNVERDDDNVAYVSNFHAGAEAPNGSLGFVPFGELPPPYSPPKAPDIDEGEPPPPYEAMEGETNHPTLEPSSNGYIPLNGYHPGSLERNEGNQSISPSHTTDITHTQGLQFGSRDNGLNPLHPRRNVESIEPQLQANGSARSVTDQPSQGHPTNGNGNTIQTPDVRNIMVSLDRNGKVKSHCQQSSPSTDNGPMGKVSATGNAVSKGACKKRHKCPHAKKVRSAVKSCSFKDEYSQTLPARGSREVDESIADKRMCNSYHAPTNTGQDDSEENTNDLVLGRTIWYKNRGADTAEKRQPLVHNINKAPSQPHFQVDSPDVAENAGANHSPVTSESTPSHSSDKDVTVVIGTVDSSNGSPSSVCSETGAKRESSNDSGEAVVMDQNNALNVSGGSGDFNSLREAMKGEHLYQEQGEGSADGDIPDALNESKESEEKCDSYEHPWADSDMDTCIDNTHGTALPSDNPTFGSGFSSLTAAAVSHKDVTSDMHESLNMVDHSKDEKYQNKIPSGISPSCSPQSHSNSDSPACKNQVACNGDVEKLRGDLGRNGMNKELMTRSACTAAECGIDTVCNSETYNSSSLDGSLSSRLKREHIKRKESPETYRRLSTAYSEANSFKQYGFIDMPYSIENMENMLRDERSKASNKKAKEAKKDTCEKKKEDKKEMLNIGSGTKDKKMLKKTEGFFFPKATENSTGKVNPMSRLSRGYECNGGNMC